MSDEPSRTPIVVPEDALESLESLRRWAATFPAERQVDVRIALTAHLDTLKAEASELEIHQAECEEGLAALLLVRARLRRELADMGE